MEGFTGPKADIAIMSSTTDATIQHAWIGAMKAYIAAKYPGLKLVTTGYGLSIQSVSFSVAEGIIHSYPDVKAIICIDSAAAPAPPRRSQTCMSRARSASSASAPRRRTGRTSPTAPCRPCSSGTRSARASWTC